MANSVIVFAGRAWRNLNRRVSRLYLDTMVPKIQHDLDKLGSDDHGWYAPKDMPDGARCYCMGVGRDATFDLALSERGAEVHSFDPTPSAVEHMEKVNNGKIQFHPWGVLDSDSSMRLYFPMDEAHGSYFIHDLHGTGRYHEVPCYRVSTIMEKLNHDSVYLVKMDIEGSWYEAVPDMLNSDIKPEFIEIEFDSPAPVWRVSKVVRALVANGYKQALREGDNLVYKKVTG